MDLTLPPFARIDHVGIAVQDIESVMGVYRDLLGLKVEGIEDVVDQKVKVAMFEVGPNRIELLEATSASSPIAQFIGKRGEGLHHIALSVENIEEAIAYFLARGCRMIDETPRDGAGKSKIAFLHPKSSAGILLELCERKA